MFTGIVKGLGEITRINDQAGIRHLTMKLPKGSDGGLEIGASVAVNGVCLTVVDWDHHGVQFDVIDETLTLSNLYSLDVGSMVNIERAACFGDEIGGHVLSGHIHAMAEVTTIQETDANLVVWWTVPDLLRKYILPKGYVALNGCSLTVGQSNWENQSSIHLIPATRALSTFNSVKVGDRLNLEVDSQTQAIVDTVERVLERRL